MNSRHGHTGAKWGKSRMSPTYMAWNNARSKYSKNILPAAFTGPGGFTNFLNELGPRPAGATLAVDDERGEYYWRAQSNRVSRKQPAPTPEMSGRTYPPLGDGPRI